MATRYQSGNQKPYITARETIQWPQDTKAVIRSHKLQLERQYNGQKEKEQKNKQ
jgi:hypothetical protein